MHLTKPRGNDIQHLKCPQMRGLWSCRQVFPVTLKLLPSHTHTNSLVSVTRRQRDGIWFGSSKEVSFLLASDLLKCPNGCFGGAVSGDMAVLGNVLKNDPSFCLCCAAFLLTVAARRGLQTETASPVSQMGRWDLNYFNGAGVLGTLEKNKLLY